MCDLLIAMCFADGRRDEHTRVLVCSSCNKSHIVPAKGDMTAHQQRCPLCNFQVLTLQNRQTGKTHTVCPCCFSNPPDIEQANPTRAAHTFRFVRAQTVYRAMHVVPASMPLTFSNLLICAVAVLNLRRCFQCKFPQCALANRSSSDIVLMCKDCTGGMTLKCSQGNIALVADAAPERVHVLRLTAVLCLCLVHVMFTDGSFYLACSCRRTINMSVCRTVSVTQQQCDSPHCGKHRVIGAHTCCALHCRSAHICYCMLLVFHLYLYSCSQRLSSSSVRHDFQIRKSATTSRTTARRMYQRLQ